GVAITLKPQRTDPSLLDRCRHFVDMLGYVGVYHFDLLKDERSDAAYFLEINGRLGGTTAKVHAYGYDEPAMLLRAFGFGEHRATTTCDTAKVIGSRQAAVKYLIS